MDYSETTQTIIWAFNEVEHKIVDRISQGIEIDLVIRILSDLLVFEYILLDKVKIESLPAHINNNSMTSKLFVESAAKKILSMSEVKAIEDENQKVGTLDRLNKMGDYVVGIFSHQNLLITFFRGLCCWP